MAKSAVQIHADVDADAQFRVLGFHEGRYYFIGAVTEQMHSWSASELMKRPALTELAGGSFWREKYPNGKVDWESEGGELIRLCQEQRYFKPSDIRGLGAWLDGKSYIIHLGDCILVDGKPVQPRQVRSRYVYPRRPPLLDIFRPNEDGSFERTAQPLTDAEGAAVLSTLKHLRWRRPFYGELLAGWVATATVPGALDWRTHCWLNGPAGSGKSFTIDKVVLRLLGNFALPVRGDSSRAGMEQALQLDARPVVYDEAEARNERSRQRREAILELMREASHEGAAQTLKGTAGHKAHHFQVRSQFLLASIGVGLREAADEMRCVVLTLRGADTVTEDQRYDNLAHFAELKRRLAEWPPDLPERLFLRISGMLDSLRANIATFAAVIAERLPGGQRFGDRLGCLLAGAYALRSSETLTIAEAHMIIEGLEDNGDLAEFGVSSMVEREYSEVVQYIMQASVTADSDSGRPITRTLGELMAVTLGEQPDDQVSSLTAANVLKRYGIRTDRPTKKIFIAATPTNRNLDAIMRGSSYATGYTRVLVQAPGAMRMRAPMRFAGTLSRAVAIDSEIAFRPAPQQEEIFDAPAFPSGDDASEQPD